MALNPRAFRPTRIVLDLFGPLINIAAIDQFRAADPRYRSEEDIAERLNGVDRTASWTGQKVLESTQDALQQWRRFPGIVDQDILQLLLEAAHRRAQVIIITTAPEDKLINAAQRAMRQTTEECFPHNLDDYNTFQLHRLSKTNEVADLTKILGDLKSAEDRYTFILHDRSKEDMPIDNRKKIYDDWVPQQSNYRDLQRRLQLAFRDEKLLKPFEWVKRTTEFILSNYRVAGDFVIFDEALRAETKEKITLLVRLLDRCRALDGTLVCVYLAGPPGSGKSYFVKEIRKALLYNGPCPITSLSGVKNEDYVNALQQHITKVVMTRAHMALLDEVDTIVRDDTAFRYLMDPMSGKLMNPWGVEDQDQAISNLLWFFAGSAGKSRQEVIRRLDRYQRKIVDFFDRIAFDFELPGADSRMEAMLIAINWLLTNFDKIRAIHGKVFLALAIADWNSMRQIITTLKLCTSGLEADARRLRLRDLVYTSSVPVFDSACKDVSDITDPNVDKFIKTRLL